MTRVEPLLVGIKLFEAVDTSEGHSGICDLGLLLKVVESLVYQMSTTARDRCSTQTEPETVT